MSIVRFDNHRTKTSRTMIEFFLLPAHDCDELFLTLKEELNKLYKPNNVRKTFSNEPTSTGLKTMSVRMWGISFEETETILNKIINQLKKKPYIVRVYKDIVGMKWQENNKPKQKGKPKTSNKEEQPPRIIKTIYLDS